MEMQHQAAPGHGQSSIFPQSVSTPSSLPHPEASLKQKLEALLQQGKKSKEVGNTWYAEHRFGDALHAYRAALKFYPDKHEETAVLHSNSAACFLQIEPVDYQAVISECSAALEIKPKYVRALVRRAKGFLGLEKVKEARQDVLKALQAECANKEAIQLLKDIEKMEKTLKSKKKKKKGSPAKVCKESKLAVQKPNNVSGHSTNDHEVKIGATRLSLAAEGTSPPADLISPNSTLSGTDIPFPASRASQEPAKQDDMPPTKLSPQEVPLEVVPPKQEESPKVESPKEDSKNEDSPPQEEFLKEVASQDMAPQEVSAQEHTGIGTVEVGAQVEVVGEVVMEEVVEEVVEEVTHVPYSTEIEEEASQPTMFKAEGHASKSVLEAIQSDASAKIHAEVEEVDNLCSRFVGFLKMLVPPCLR